MRRIWILLPVALLAMGLMVGCGGSNTDTTGEDAKAVADDHGKGAEAEFAAATLEGSLGCGHCTFSAKSECSLAMKTKSGDVVFIEAGARQDELMAKRMDEPAVHIEGKMTTVDGQKVIYADNIQYN